jgi:hypothetical protein
MVTICIISFYVKRFWILSTWVCLCVSFSPNAVYGVWGLRPLEQWDRGFESIWGMDVCLRLFCACVDLCRWFPCGRTDPPSKASYRLSIRSIKKVKLSMNRPWRPIWLWDVEAPTFSLDSSQMAVRMSALRAGRRLPPRKIPGTHFCWRLSRPQRHSVAGRVK